jgi:7-alpha-hydroxysteroid dehydrogenase
VILDRFSLKDKVAIVTGAGRGIGQGIAVAFAEAGADVTCAARTVSEIEATAAEVRRIGRRALAIPCDVRDAEQVQNMVNKTVEAFGRIDILVNNAAAAEYGRLMDTTPSSFASDLNACLISAFLCIKTVVPIMQKQKSGSIINISSRQFQMPSLGQGPYGAAKAGMNSITKTLAWELAPYIRVNAILPGAIMHPSVLEYLGPVKNMLIEGTPLRRTGTPEDIALAAIYLASPASEWVTGKLLEVDGGMEFSYNIHVALGNLA